MENENVVKRVRRLCKEKGIKISKLEKDLNFGNGYLNPKKIKDLKSDRLMAILNYIGVSVEEFYDLGSKTTQEIETSLAQIKKASPEVYEDLREKWLAQPEPEKKEDPPEIRMIARAGKKMEPERRQEMLRVLTALYPDVFGDEK